MNKLIQQNKVFVFPLNYDKVTSGICMYFIIAFIVIINLHFLVDIYLINILFYFYSKYIFFNIQHGQSLYVTINGTEVVEVVIDTFTLECLYWNEKVETWKADGCVVSSLFTIKVFIHLKIINHLHYH